MKIKRTRKVESSGAISVGVVPVPVGELQTPVALLNDVVLQNIFKYLGYKDLKTIRDVKNSVWLRNSKTAWWSRSKVTLTKEKVDEYLNQSELHSCVKNYKFKYFGAADYKGIWDHFGHSIKYLELACCELGSLDDFRHIFYTKCRNLEKLVTRFLRLKESILEWPNKLMEWQEPQFGQQKNLKFLKLNFSFGQMALSWMELLSHFPKLEGLESNTNVDVYKVTSIIRQHDPKMLKLKHIVTHGLSRNDHEASLRLVLLDPNLSFETLRIRHEIKRLETLVDILDLHAKSLKEFSISGGIARTCNQISLRQPLLNLETLSLIGCLFTADILRFTPNLRKFELYFGEARNLLKCADLNMRFNQCKELTINVSQQWKDLPNSDLEFFLNAFPNVEILVISGLSNLTFSMICERWTKLVTLRAYDSEVDLFGLLGFDSDSTTKTTRNPNIMNLKGIRTFSMSSNLYGENEMEEREDAKIEVRSGEVLLKELDTLPQLKKFELKNYRLENREPWDQLFAKYSGN